MKVAISYTTKNRPDLRQETLPRVALNPAYDLHIVDGSDDVWRPGQARHLKWYTFHSNIRGGADASLVYCLSMMLNHEANYTHVGIVEMDVLLDEGWFEATMALFEKGSRDGLCVGAVSPRSYVDRVLCQRDSYAVMHNLGAGVVIFTREAAELVLRTFRTGFWPDNIKLFAQLSGIDLRTYAAFRGNEQPVTSDWLWDAMLAKHGFASLALTPSRCTMIGQVPSLAEQGLILCGDRDPPCKGSIGEETFRKYAAILDNIRKGYYLPEQPSMIQREGVGMLVFPHQIGAINAIFEAEQWKLKWVQGYGPFAFEAHEGARINFRISGPLSILASGGTNGAKVTIEDTRSGFKTSPDLPPSPEPVSIQVPGGSIPRLITCQFGKGAVFYGLQTADPQMIDTTWKFDWSQLPEAT